MRRRALIVAAPVLVAGAASAIVATSGGSDGEGARAGERPEATARVERTTLVERQRVDGTLGYRDERPALARLSGTVTWLAPEGAVVRHGQALMKVDGEPVVLFDGRVPAYRTLSTGSPDGDDVLALERGLQRLGHHPGTVDDDFTAATAQAVRDWQRSLGLEATGKVELGRVVFLPGARRVSDHEVGVGEVLGAGGGGGGDANASTTAFASLTTGPSGPTGPTGPSGPTGSTGRQPSTPKSTATPAASSPRSGGADDDDSGAQSAPATEALTTTSTRRVVTLEIGAVDQTIAREGARVQVELPDGDVVPGRVARVGRVAKEADSGGEPGGEEGGPTVAVTVRLTGKAPAKLDQAPVSVELARETRRDVLAVPVTALVARRGGGYAVAVVGRGPVAVEPGLFADGLVEIEGDVREGDRVEVPAG